MALHLLLVNNFDCDLLSRITARAPRIDLPKEPFAEKFPLNIVLLNVPVPSASLEFIQPGIPLCVAAHKEHSLERFTQLHLDLLVVDALYLNLDSLVALDVAGDKGMHEFYFLLSLIDVACQVLPLKDQVEALVVILRFEVHSGFMGQVLCFTREVVKLA